MTNWVGKIRHLRFDGLRVLHSFQLHLWDDSLVSPDWMRLVDLHC